MWLFLPICADHAKSGKKERVQQNEIWKAEHRCTINHVGSAGSMEAVESKQIFQRSTHAPQKLQYTRYLDDGDSASFKKVAESKPYGEEEIVKLECGGHVQKRVGARCRRLKQDFKGKKLEDGKGIAGAGRLTR